MTSQALSLKEIHAQQQAKKASTQVTSKGSQSVSKTGNRKTKSSQVSSVKETELEDSPKRHLTVLQPVVKPMSETSTMTSSITTIKDTLAYASLDNYLDVNGTVDQDKLLEDLLKLKYGEIPLCLTTEDVYRLANSKTLPVASVVMIYILMHYGKDFVMNGGTIFEEEGAIAKLALRYGMEPDVVGRTVTKLITANTKWEKLSMPTQMVIPFEFDEKSK